MRQANFWKDHPCGSRFLSATSALAFAGTSLVYAQRFSGPDARPATDGCGRERFGRRPTTSALSPMRGWPAMKAGLRLNAEQEKNWPAFEQAWRNLAKLRADAYLARAGRTDRRRPTFWSACSAAPTRCARVRPAFKDFTDATAPLYKSLDDTQKRRFAVLARDAAAEAGPASAVTDRGPRDFGPGRFHQRGGFEQPRFGEGGMSGQEFRSGAVMETTIRDGSAEEHRIRPISGAGRRRRAAGATRPRFPWRGGLLDSACPVC